jgi:hypothetical protein
MNKYSSILLQIITTLGISIGSIILIDSSVIANPIEQDNYRFKLQNCKYKSDRVTCEFLITNLIGSENRHFALRGGRIIDLSGEEYRSDSLVQLGQRKSQQGVVGTDLIPNVPLKGYVLFLKVPRSVTKLAVLEIEYYANRGIGEGYGEGKVKFNNITIGGVSKTTSELPTESNTSDTASTSTCTDGEKTFLAAETNNFEIAICGKNKPTHYIGKSKQGGSSIKLPLSAASRDRYIAKNGNVNYIVTSKYLTIVQNGRTIQQDALRISK